MSKDDFKSNTAQMERGYPDEDEKNGGSDDVYSNVPIVSAGTGATATKPGAKTQTVANVRVSLPSPCHHTELRLRVI